jgi:O-antigen/teichoic acid export membrane protein
MSTRRALLFSFLDRYSGLILTVVSSMVIARLLSPEEIGVFSVAMVLSALSAILRDFGIGQYLVQVRELTDDKIRVARTIQFSAAAVMGLLIAALAYPVMVFYDEPRLLPILGLMALNSILTPVGSINFALLTRDMRFQHIAVMRFAASLTGALTSVALAWRGVGPMSLALGQVVSTGTIAAVSLLYSRKGLPTRFSFQGAREALDFGSRLLGTSITQTLTQSMPDLLLGKLQGMATAGLYSRSNGLVAMFHRLVSDAVYAVALAHFARAKRENQDPLPDFLRAMNYIIVLNTTFAISIVLLADPIIRLMYGEQWVEAIPLTRWLAVAGIFFSPQPICIALLTGLGRTDLLLRAMLIGGCALTVASIIGAIFGMSWLGPSMLLGNVVCGLVWLSHVRQICACSITALVGSLVHSLATATLGCLPLAMVMTVYGLTPTSSLKTLLMAAPLSLFGFLGAVLVTRHPLHVELRRLIANLRYRITRPSSTGNCRP